ncbi:RICIN domain-containing protein [Agarivorans aestuarii]|uniref:RICIN domain-containing protein n=1 Tax=Agarivorans aestuarii TaxID=1563703 RepID=A0ABU7G1T5_9ALTE|nr:RICIN domain-containing protein [Agarivorans aestuarii]MEE1673220.1 RICIN domain-containing protein [Agarivorans aestuarii]
MINRSKISMGIALAFTVTVPLSAATVSDAEYRNIEVKHSSKCVDLSGGNTTNFAPFVQWTCGENNANQRFEFVESGDGFYSLKIKTSNKCLEVKDGNANNGALIQQFDCQANDSKQNWSLIDMNNGWFKLKNQQTGKCLDVAGAYIQNGDKFHQWACLADHPNQEFRFIYDQGSSDNSSPDDLVGTVTIQAEDFVSQGGTFDDQQQTPVSKYTVAGQGAINYINSGDFVDYAVNVEKAGMYLVSFNVGTAITENASIELLVMENGVWRSYAQARVPANGWNNFSELTASGEIALPAGAQQIRIHALGSNDWQWNLESFKLVWQGDLDGPIAPPVLDDDNDGVLNANDLCPNTPANEAVDQNGCSQSQLDDDNDGVNNAIDLCPNTPAGGLVDNTGCEVSLPNIIDVNTADPNFPTFVSFTNTTPQGKRWEKVENLSDEFEFWNGAKWLKTNWNYGNTPVNMLNKNSGVSDGNLWIQATLNADSPNHWFETSRVRSVAKIKFPMYTESRIKVANISAYSTFWLNNGDINNRDEIDIIEINPVPTCNCQPDFPWKMNSQYFIAKNGSTERNHGNSDNRTDLSDENTLQGVLWTEEYHVFGAWWKDEHTVQFYLNGEPVNSVTTQQPFTLEQFIIWDLWSQDSSWVGGLPQKEDLLNNNNNTMKVDWIRTWKLVNE